MAISLTDLTAAVASISNIGKGEIDIDVNGTPVTMRVLLPEEEVDVQRYAAEAYDEGDPDNSASTLDYFDRFRQYAVAKAIVQIGTLDLRGVDTIETGETLANGKPVVTPKDQAMRKLLRQWGRTIMIAMFNKHHELTDKSEQDSEKAIEFDPADLDAEIERLEHRIEDIKEERKRRDQTNQNLFRTFYDGVQNQGQEPRRERALEAEQRATTPMTTAQAAQVAQASPPKQTERLQTPQAAMPPVQAPAPVASPRQAPQAATPATPETWTSAPPMERQSAIPQSAAPPEIRHRSTMPDTAPQTKVPEVVINSGERRDMLPHVRSAFVNEDSL